MERDLKSSAAPGKPLGLVLHLLERLTIGTSSINNTHGVQVPEDGGITVGPKYYTHILICCGTLHHSIWVSGPSEKSLPTHYAPTAGDRRLVQAIASSATLRVQDFGCQGLSNTAWAFAKLAHHSPELCNLPAVGTS